MNTPITFEIAKLLKEKGFDLDCDNYYKEGQLPVHGVNNLNGKRSWNHVVPPKEYYSAPTIAEVVMWLYEKHGIWISVNREPETGVFYFSVDKNKGNFFYDKGDDFNSPTEAYLAAIEYVLKKII